MIAARVAGGNFWRTSLDACRLAIVAYVMPFFFVYNPVLLFVGDLTDLLRAFCSAVVGVIALSGALTRYFFIRRLPWWECVLLGVGGFMLFSPEHRTDILGIVLIMPTVVLTVLSRRRAKLATAR